MAMRYLTVYPEIVDGVLYSDVNTLNATVPDGSNLTERKYFGHDVSTKTFSTSHQNADTSMNFELCYDPDAYAFRLEKVNSVSDYCQLVFSNSSSIVEYFAQNFVSGNCKDINDIKASIIALTANSNNLANDFSPDSFDIIPLFTHYFDLIKSELIDFNVDELDEIIAVLDVLGADSIQLKAKCDSLSVDLDSLNYDMDLLISPIEDLLSEQTNIFLSVPSLNGQGICFLDGELVTVDGFDGFFKVLSSHVVNLGDTSDYLYYVEKQIEGLEYLPRFTVISSSVKKVL